MGDACTTKPTGPKTLFVNAETTAGTYAPPAATDVLHLFGEPKIGGQTSEREWSDETHIKGGRYEEDVAGLNDVPFEFTIPVKGDGTAGDTMAAYDALMVNGAGLAQTVVGGTSVEYASTAAPCDTAVSIATIDRRTLSVEQAWGAIVQLIKHECEVDGSKPRTTFSGMCQRKLVIEKTTLDGVVLIGATSMILTDAECIRFGLSDTTISSLAVRMLIEDEVVLVTAWNVTTRTATITRAQEGTAAAEHADTTAVYPWLPAPTFQEGGVSVAKTDWTVTVGGDAFRARSLSFEFNTGRVFDPRSGGLSYSDSMDWEGHNGTGTIGYMRSLAREHERRNIDTGTSRELVLTMGSTAGSIATLTIAYARLKGIDDGALEKNKATESSIEFEAFDQATDFGPQYKIVHT